MPELGKGLSGKVAEDLGLAIAGGRHAPGEVLRTDDLAERFGVSRTVVREAVQALQAKRLLRSSPRVGLTVRVVQEWHLYDPDVIRWRLAGSDRRTVLDELTELRAAVEPVAAAAAARRTDRQERTRLLESSARMRAAAAVGDRTAFLEADVDFHCLVLGMCGNPLFAQLAPVTQELLRGRAALKLLPTAPDPADADRHDAVALAVAAGDPERAEVAMRAVVAESLEDIHMRLAARQGD
ncbi:GntR domain protein [Catenulispora acidiphila DSM 44928]|uniref:GntR domain protein n=1 Tax=Catenulispora acidiphila (strain DSM 44928 / JCM 14897 / NBRC 102108 / NRRL B-24433 / ID139908) TaxID=479433 RepID=C7Q1W7_CATAD|nr:FCD domain-containing protein [Catenulispora acidiphila]ACU75668.1 GntR domain protein [Catenulispora acidiphila DSM 44928]